MHNEFNGLEKIDLASAELHAPVEVSISVYISLPDGRMGTMRATLPPGQIPSRGELKQVFDGFASASGAIPGAPVGARLATRGEFVSHIVKRETGQAFALDAGAQYSPLPGDVPHGILVNAILGVGVDDSLIPEYKPRGLIVETMQGAKWLKLGLVGLPDDELMSIYKRVSA